MHLLHYQTCKACFLSVGAFACGFVMLIRALDSSDAGCRLVFQGVVGVKGPLNPTLSDAQSQHVQVADGCCTSDALGQASTTVVCQDGAVAGEPVVADFALLSCPVDMMQRSICSALSGCNGNEIGENCNM